MKRTRRTKTVIPAGDKPLWKKLTGTYHAKDGTIYKAGDYFRADEKDVPKAFRDTIIRVEEKKPEPPAYTITKRSTGWFDVVDAKTFEAINKQALRKPEADALLEELLKG